MSEFDDSVSRDLAWRAVVDANKADTAVKEARAQLDDLKRLAAIGLDGVVIKDSAEEEAVQRVRAAEKQFRTILKITGLLDVKTNNPNRSIAEQSKVPATKNQELAFELRDKGVIEMLEISGEMKPVLGEYGFREVALAVDGSASKQLASRAFNAVNRGFSSSEYGQTPALHRHFDGEEMGSVVKVFILDVEYLGDLRNKIRPDQSKVFSRLPGMGTKSIKLVENVLDFVIANRDDLIPNSQTEQA